MNKQKVNEIISQLSCGALSAIQKKRILGKGTEGAVYEWCVTVDDCPYVVKIQKVNKERWDDVKTDLIDEITKTNKYSTLDIAPKVYAFKECKSDGVFMMLMDKVEGQTIAKLMMKDKLTPPIFKKIIDTVRIVHAQGDYHSDLNPANVFYSDGTIILIDFGMRYKKYKMWYDFIGMLYYFAHYYENSRNPNKLKLYKSFVDIIVKIVKTYNYSNDKCTRIFLEKAKEIENATSNLEMIDVLIKFRVFSREYFIFGEECDNEQIDEDFEKPLCSDFIGASNYRPKSMIENVESDSGYLLYGFVYDNSTKSDVLSAVKTTLAMTNKLNQGYDLTAKITSMMDCKRRKLFVRTQDYSSGKPLVNYYKTSNKMAFLNTVGALLFIHRLGYTDGNPTVYNTYYNLENRKTVFTGLYYDGKNSYHDYIKFARSVAIDYLNGAEIESTLLKEIFADVFSLYEIEKEQLYGDTKLRSEIINIFEAISTVAKSPGFRTIRHNLHDFLSMSKIY